MRRLIKLTLNEFINKTLEKTKKPFAFLKYEGKEKEYLTYTHHGKPGLFADESNEATVYEVSVSVYSDKNYISLVENVTSIMKEAGFIWTDSGEDMRDDETGLYYKVLYFEIERCDFIWQQ